VTAEAVIAPVEAESAIGNAETSAIADSTEYAEVRVRTREESVTGNAGFSVAAWARREFQPPEVWAEMRPAWMWARYGEQCPASGPARFFSQVFAALVALPVTGAAAVMKWIVERPTRLFVFLTLYVLVAAASGGVMPEPW
jgi:hypothetical protein